MVALREAMATLREAASRETLRVAHRRTKKAVAAPRLGRLTAQNQGTPRLGFHVSGVTPLIPDHFWYRLSYVSQYQ
jgi:hypothetical protein